MFLCVEVSSYNKSVVCFYPMFDIADSLIKVFSLLPCILYRSLFMYGEGGLFPILKQLEQNN